MKALSQAKAVVALVVMAAVAFPGVSRAQAGGNVTTITRGHVWTQSGGTFSVGTLSDGGPTYSTQVPVGSATGSVVGGSGGTISSGSVGGEPAMKTTTRVPVAAGRTVAVDVVNKVSKAEAAAAIGRYIGRMAGHAFMVVGFAVATKQLLSELGYTPQASADGSSVEILKPDPSTDGWCTSAPCYEYNGIPGQPAGSWYKSREAACAPAAAQFCSSNPSLTNCHLYSVSVNDGGGFGQCTFQYTQTNGATLFSSYSLVRRTRLPDSGPRPSVVTPLQELTDKIASQSGWPSSAGNALAEVVTGGEKVPVQAPTVSGPASVPGPTTTRTEQGKVDPQTGKKGNATTTTSTTYQNTYNNNTVNVTAVDNSTTVWNYEDGSTRTEQSTSQEEPEPQAGQVKDPPMPEVPTLYERKYPDGLVGVWNVKKAQLAETPLGQLKTQLMPNIGEGGQCPVWMLPVNLSTLWSFGEYDVAPPCWVWDFGKAVVIVSALLLARALVFGG